MGSPAAAYCTQCGARATGYRRFCAACGTPLAPPDAEGSVIPAGERRQSFETDRQEGKTDEPRKAAESATESSTHHGDSDLKVSRHIRITPKYGYFRVTEYEQNGRQSSLSNFLTLAGARKAYPDAQLEGDESSVEGTPPAAMTAFEPRPVAPRSEGAISNSAVDYWALFLGIASLLAWLLPHLWVPHRVGRINHRTHRIWSSQKQRRPYRDHLRSSWTDAQFGQCCNRCLCRSRRSVTYSWGRRRAVIGHSLAYAQAEASSVVV
jgi:hypothetical protein